MDPKKLSQTLLVGGAVITAMALAWWASFYGQITGEIGAELADAFPCLYSSSGPCGFLRGVAQFAGITPYSPTTFWIGFAMMGVGVLVKLSAPSPSDVANSRPFEETSVE